MQIVRAENADLEGEEVEQVKQLKDETFSVEEA